MRGWLVGALVAAFVLTPVAVGIAFLVPRDDVPQDPAAVVVLGGSAGERAALGIEVADRYDAELVLSSSAALYGELQGRVCGEDALCFEPEPGNTAGEAADVAAMAAERGWDHVTVVTTDFHTSRSRYLFRQCLGDAVSVVGAERPEPLVVDAVHFVREGIGTLAGATVRRAC